MRIDDKEIDKLLEEFKGEDIKVPEILDSKLNEKLIELRPKKKNIVIKSLIASVVILVLSYSIIPDFKTFADNVFKYIFGDVGVENAVNNGYENIPDQTIDINGYKVDVENIYIDNLRLVFDVKIKADKPKSEEEQYSIHLVSKDSSEILNQCITEIDYKGYDEKSKSSKSTVQVIFKDKEDFLQLKENKIKQKIELVKYYSGEDGIGKGDSLGKSEIIFNIPKDLKNSKLIEINKSIRTGRLSLDIKNLEVSPTMMYLDTKGKVDGVLVAVKKDIKVDLNNKNNISLDYLGYNVVIKDVFYKDGKLTLEIIKNNDVAYAGISILEGQNVVEEYQHDNIHGFVFETTKKDEYNIQLELVMKYKTPIEIDINK